ncbi:MAG: hypothetical protein ACPGID_05285 [Rubricella sp.]
MTRIAVLGWGSLIWDLGVLAPKTAGGWAMRGGPALPMEFSRISPKRRMGLVVCLDPEHGVACATHAIRSTRVEIEAAVEDLAEREIAPVERIGFTFRGTSHGRLSAVAQAVADWCASEGWDGAVWTDLEPNYEEHRGERFSVPGAMGYLRTLRGASLSEAHRYIEEAPETTRTPLRVALERDAWWTGLRGTLTPPEDIVEGGG